MMWGFGGSWLGFVFMVAWWALVVAGIVWLVRAPGGPGESPGSARRILDERFAAGELSVEEYEACRRVLR